MRNLIANKKSKSNFLFSFFVVLVTFFVAEIVLKTFLPYHIATIGHIDAYNAKIYGWGFDQNEKVKTLDPDTGEVYIHPANNHGWRDRDRNFTNDTHSYRILVLGDSVTYGAIVPAQKIYTWVLEDLLREQGYNVEVLNIGHGGWGTDQELVALQTEGLKYKPNLVIMQFTANDLEDNTYFLEAEKKGKRNGLKPFYFSFDENHQLIKKKNPYFMAGLTCQDKLKVMLFKSQIVTRVYGLYLSVKMKEDVELVTSENENSKNLKRVYNVNKNQLMQLVLALDLKKEDKLFKYLESSLNKLLNPRELLNVISSTRFGHRKKMILRVLEKRWFHESWSFEHYNFDRYQKPESLEWQLYFALIQEANSLIKTNGSKLLLFCQNEIGQFEWNTFWYRIRNDEETKLKWLKVCGTIKDFAKQSVIDFIDNTKHYERARNDSHPNINGNKSMAEDIYLYLMSNHKDELDNYRLK